LHPWLPHRPCSSYKHRFKLTGNGKVIYPRPGYVHKRFNKSKGQLGELSGTQALKPRYAKAVKRLAFRMRHY
jgi:ribosomal protein L35